MYIGWCVLVDVCEMLDKERKVVEDMEARSGFIHELSSAAEQVKESPLYVLSHDGKLALRKAYTRPSRYVKCRTVVPRHFINTAHKRMVVQRQLIITSRCLRSLDIRDIYFCCT